VAGGPQITISAGSGTCSVVATKAADANYRSATSPAATVGAKKADQSALRVTGMPAADQPQGATFTVSTSGGNGTGAVNFAAGAGSACSVDTTSGRVAITSGSGTCSVTATKAEDANYNNATSAAATVRATQPAPTPGTGVMGMYMGLRVNFDGKQYPDYYTFLSDGRAFRGTPDEGFARPMDWTVICAASECGTYTVSGDQVTFHRQQADDQLFTIDAQGVLRKPGQTHGYRKMHELDNVRLSATYGFVSGADTIAAISLGSDGRFQERGILHWVAWTSPAGASGPASGAGTYTITRSTLELRYENGPTVYMVIAIPPGFTPSSAPEGIYLRTTTLERIP
jgi:hypothetical protein